MPTFMRGALLSLLAVPTLLPLTVVAQTGYPTQSIRVVVPFPPAGGPDTVTRLLTDKLHLATGWTMVIHNRPGAGGNIGMEVVAKSKGDGYTPGMGQTANLAINPFLPETPTIDESGFKGFETSDWKALMAPAGTPADVIARLNAEADKAMSRPDTIAQLLAEGSVPMSGSPQQVAKFLKSKQQRWGAAVRDADVKIE
jgi:tripartite-type tricarboxylate transporter receptor subunit TctC